MDHQLQELTNFSLEPEGLLLSGHALILLPKGRHDMA